MPPCGRHFMPAGFNSPVTVPTCLHLPNTPRAQSRTSRGCQGCVNGPLGEKTVWLTVTVAVTGWPYLCLCAQLTATSREA